MVTAIASEISLWVRSCALAGPAVRAASAARPAAPYPIFNMCNLPRVGTKRWQRRSMDHACYNMTTNPRQAGLQARAPARSAGDKPAATSAARRRGGMLTLITAVAALVASAPAAAQSWPSRPLTMVVPFGAGGATDVMARALAPRLSELLGQQVIVEN